jgi:two-component system response regulator RegA
LSNTLSAPNAVSDAAVLSPSLLIVDDDAVLRERLAHAFRRRGYVVHTASNHAEGLATARRESPELAVIDLRMPGPSGLELLRDLKAIDPETKVVVLTGYGSIATTVDAMKLGAIYYLQKPADPDQILAAFSQDDPGALGRNWSDPEPPSLERVKWEHINRVLEDCGGSVSEAARRLKLHRRTLQRMLQKYPPTH